MALVGVFPLAGFWSKDEILLEAWAEKPVIFWTALAGVFLTAIYVGRMLFLTFGGEYRGGEAAEHGGEAGHGRAARVAVGDAGAAGGAGGAGGDGGVREHRRRAGRRPGGLAAGAHPRAGGARATSSSGYPSCRWRWGWRGWRWPGRSTAAGSSAPRRIRNALWPLPALLERKYFLDDLYETVLLKGVVLRGLATLLDAWDRYVVDGVVNGVATAVRFASEQLRLAQAGQAQVYGAAIFIGVVAHDRRHPGGAPVRRAC